MKSKKGEATGESVITIGRIFLISIVAFVVLGLSSVFYNYEVSVKDSEALIFARQVVDCAAPDGVLNLNVLDGNKAESFLSSCGFDKSETERFFFSVVAEENGKEVGRLTGGDENLPWVKKVYTGGFKTESIKKYEPGYYNGVFSIGVLKDGVERDGKIKVEVIVKDES